ncbi:MAG: hypothetical protein IT359_12985 [Gemmatimonadaceae bacterium]|nr:hypothetical protein [Gemmatimonadaceae bacterium]
MLLSSFLLAAQLAAPARAVAPVLAFPEPGLDDSAAYQGYQTRIFRDATGNTLQVYLDQRQGRVVHLLADAENASVGLSARNADGSPAALHWGGERAQVSRRARQRVFSHDVTTSSASLTLGWFVLGTMRVERDFQYEGRHRAPFGNAPFVVPETQRLVDALASLPDSVQRQHLAALRASSVDVVRGRLRPSMQQRRWANGWEVRVTQPSLDGRDTMAVALRGDARSTRGEIRGDSVIVAATGGGGVRLTLEVVTTGASLTPLARTEIFTAGFLAFVDSVRQTGERDAGARTQARWMERQVRGVELLSSREKLMAGLPTYATYFGRDMLVTALMMRDIWRSDMSAFAVAAALRKLSPRGEVSHEEALGGQAVREAAGEYAALVQAQRAARARGEGRVADSLLARALVVLRAHRRVRENYHMIDDELHLPILLARWLGDPSVSASRKRAFLREGSDGPGSESRLARVLRELALVARMTAPYAAAPSAATLISFARRDDGGWAATSWRDSGVGYAGGRYAMDVNAIWAPHALQAMRTILASLRALGFPTDSLQRALPQALGDTPLGAWVRDSAQLARAIDTWLGAGRHFMVRLSPNEVQQHVTARLAALPAVERGYWEGVLAQSGADRDSLTFLALSLDSAGAPIGVVNSDVATRLFLGDPLRRAMDHAVVRRDTRQFVREFPVGLFIAGVGPVVANDAYATPKVWSDFERDRYHAPRVAWGREVNLFLLGVAYQARMGGAGDAGYDRELHDAATKVLAAVEASGFKSELWSYDFVNGVPRAVRYGSGGDVQLWSTTDLAVQYALARWRR